VAEVLGDAAKRAVAAVQDYALLSGPPWRTSFTSPHYFQDTLEQMDFIGAGSLPIILLSGFFIRRGHGVADRVRNSFALDRHRLTGDVVAIALVRELGPAFTGLLVTGRCATGIASELGSMLVTEQVDAMRAMGTDPSRKLVAPRLLAALLMMPLLTALDGFYCLLGGLRRVRFFLALKCN